MAQTFLSPILPVVNKHLNFGFCFDSSNVLLISSIKLPENVTPTIQGRDFVVATLAAPTVIKEPEKPAEAVTVEGAEGAEGEAKAAEGAEGEVKTTEAGKKEGDKQEDKKAPAEKK